MLKHTQATGGKNQHERTSHDHTDTELKLMLTLKLTEVTTSTQTCNTKEKGMKMTGKLCFVMVLVICSNYAYKGKNEYLYHCKQSNFFKTLFVAKNIDTCSEYTVDCQS